ncbi:MAG: hypothetical protein KIS78_15395 [Labilithrix sp.]|nr:hypothetical protein [Labilithrix sp.]
MNPLDRCVATANPLDRCVATVIPLACCVATAIPLDRCVAWFARPCIARSTVCLARAWDVAAVRSTVRLAAQGSLDRLIRSTVASRP